jgi:hypothetical protein
MDSTGLYYFNARYMDPEIGRFISRDPAMDGANWYVYCRNNPLKYVDPDGKHARWISYIPIFGLGYTIGEGLYHLFGGVDAQDHSWQKWQAAMLSSAVITAGTLGVVKLGSGAVILVVQSSGKAVTLRDQLLGSVQNQKLWNTINEMFRPGATVGNGGLADAIRYELNTGKLVGGVSHIQKGFERVTNLQNIIKAQKLNPYELNLAQELLKDLLDALKGVKK